MKIRLTKAQIQVIINVVLTITLILIGAAGYTVTILDPAKDLFIERMDALGAQVEALGEDAPPFLAAGTSHFTNVSTTGTMTAGLVRTTVQATQTVTDDGSIDATGTYVPVTAIAGVSKIYTITNCAAGDVLTIINTGTNTVGISDSLTMMLSAEMSMGQYDTLTLWCDGTNSIEVGRSNN